MKQLRIIYIVTVAVAFVLGSITIYWLLLKITGHSPTTDEIMIVLLSFIGVGILNITQTMGELKAKMEEHNKKFDALAYDFKIHISKKGHQ